jgi:hypothetical protein
LASSYFICFSSSSSSSIISNYCARANSEVCYGVPELTNGRGNKIEHKYVRRSGSIEIFMRSVCPERTSSNFMHIDFTSREED